MSKENPESQPETIVVEREGGLLHTYANNINLDWTKHDIRLRFAEITLLPEYKAKPGTQRIEERVSVSVSWSEAKAFHMLLGSVLQEFETLNGPIEIPRAPGYRD